MKTEISNYMREMQRRSAKARWSGLSAGEKRAKMSALAKARWAKTKRKPKRVDRRSNHMPSLEQLADDAARMRKKLGKA